MAISERLSQAAEKAWRIEQLTAANHAYLEMLAFVSHEIKNPVASIVTDARLLADGYLGALEQPQKEKLERLIGKAQYLLELAQDYLDLARVDGGQLVLEADPKVDVVNEVVLPAVDIVRSQIDRRSMHVELCLPDETAVAQERDRALSADRRREPAEQRGQVRQRGRRDPCQRGARTVAPRRLGVERRAGLPSGGPRQTVPVVLDCARLRRRRREPEWGSTAPGGSSSCITGGSGHGRSRESGPSSHSSSPSRWAARPGSSSLARVATSPARGEVQTTAVMMGSAQTGAPADGAPPLLPEKGAHRQLRDRRRSRRGGRESPIASRGTQPSWRSSCWSARALWSRRLRMFSCRDAPRVF